MFFLKPETDILQVTGLMLYRGSGFVRAPWLERLVELQGAWFERQVI